MPPTPLELGPVDSDESLRSVVAELQSSHPNDLLLFRGQNNLHPTVRSGLSRPDVRYEPDVEQGLSALAGIILGQQKVTPANVPFRKAVLQHYGYKSHYVDLTADPNIAAWFSANRFEPRPLVYGGCPFRHIDQVRYEERTDGLGFVLVLAFPKVEALISGRSLFDISDLQPFLRPRRQKAWLLRDRPPLLPDPNGFWVATIRIDCGKFRSSFSSEYLFPLPNEDQGFKSLLNTPFVEIPGGWLNALREARRNREQGEEKNEPKSELDDNRIDFGMRAMPIPEYVHSEGKDEYDHKWNDSTLTEPRPMQMWVHWTFDQRTEFPDIAGDVRDATKVTLSPRAAGLLCGPGRKVRLRWPALGTNELLFTFSQFGHDKVIDIEYPYHGVWLHRDKDLLFEHPMSADEKALTVHKGHVFEFVGQDLLRQDLPSSCACRHPRAHDERVRAMLRLSALVEAEAIILLPHPFRIPNWYFAL